MSVKVTARFKRDRKRIRRLVKKWEPLLALPGVDVHHAFIANFKEGDDEFWTPAECEADPQYRSARIKWFMHSVARLADEDLEEVLVHEYVHILLSPLDKFLKKGSTDPCELATQNVALALLGVAK
ncbi:MAG: hypothetical protein ACXVGB_00150 [Mycobacteriaceae bacterium]